MDTATTQPISLPIKALTNRPAAAVELADCPICEASGDADGCASCGDSRTIEADEVCFYVDCPDCDGRRSMGVHRCDGCKGYGVCHEDDAIPYEAAPHARSVR